jgi:hypothetical protein
VLKDGGSEVFDREEDANVGVSSADSDSGTDRSDDEGEQESAVNDNIQVESDIDN